MAQFEGKIAVVTGGTQGLGAAIAWPGIRWVCGLRRSAARRRLPGTPQAASSPRSTRR